MKKLFITLLTIYFLFNVFCSYAQVPQLFNYQGIARDVKGNPMSNKTMTLKISVLPTADASQAEYQEIQTVKTNEFGLYTLQIGNGTALSGEMKTVKWETGNKYINVAIDPNGGSNYVNAGTNQLLSVPYAIYADKAGTAANADGKTRTGGVVTAAGTTGDANMIAKFNGTANTLTNSSIFDNGSRIGIGTLAPSASAKVHIISASGTQPMILESPVGVHCLFRESGLNRGYFGSYIGSGAPYPTPAGTSNADFDIGTSGSNPTGKLHLATQTTPRVTIDNVGLVGIATTTPTTNLDVNGQIRVRGGAPAAGKVLTSDANGLATWQSNSLSNIIQGSNVGDVLVWNGSAWVSTPKCNLFSYFYRDADGDGFGDKFNPIFGCAALPGFTSDSTDCDDTQSLINPNKIWYQDNDLDGFGNLYITITSCVQPNNFVDNSLDCNDNNAFITIATTYFQDADADGFGNQNVSILACTQPNGYVTNSDDCNDTNPLITIGSIYFQDADADGFGNSNVSILSCFPVNGYVLNNGDCNDFDNSISPGAIEICNGIDDDCDGTVDEGCL